MDKIDFKTDYSISDVIPQKIRKTVCGSMTFANYAKDFIEENFNALAQVENEVNVSTPILINTEYAAYFFKNLFSAVYGRLYLSIKFYSDNQYLNVRIAFPPPIAISYFEMNELIRQARSAGFEIHSIENGFDMGVPLLKEASLSIYAIPVDLGAQIIKHSFNNIFFYKSTY